MWCVGLLYVWYYGITGHSMSMCMLAHDNMDGALHCLHACAWLMCTCECLHGAMCTVHTAAQTHVCVRLYVYDCMLEGVRVML